MSEPRFAKQEIKKIKELVTYKTINIPEYQRPYKWTEHNVIQLLDDIYEHIFVNQKIYRIGSIILHHNNEHKLDVVDGQQRLTTISILLKALGEQSNLLLGEEYIHKISQNNIIYNYRVIKNWLNKINDKTSFKEMILKHCEFVLFTVYDQDEAFQLFDSQNSRGKELEPYDLLKAFHLREMEQDSEEDREKCIGKWENAIENNTLKIIINDHLYRIRKWSKNQKFYQFTKQDIDEFKGISLYQKQVFPFESSIRYLDGFIENAQNDKFLKNNHIAQSYPFSITMPIINGKRFFEYIDNYIQLKESIFKDESFHQFYKQYCKDYNVSYRSGDQKVRNIYDNILLHFVDRFGLTDEFESMYIAFYKATYQLRCNNKSITENSILNSNTLSLFEKINYSNDTQPFKHLIYKNYKFEKELVKGIQFIKFFIENGFNFRNELYKSFNPNELMTGNNHYIISIQTNSNEQINLYIGDNQNPYWYGFDQNEFQQYTPEIKQKIELHIQNYQLDKVDNEWKAWKEFEPMTKHQFYQMITEINAFKNSI